MIELCALERLYGVGRDQRSCCQVGNAGESVRARVHRVGPGIVIDFLTFVCYPQVPKSMVCLTAE